MSDKIEFKECPCCGKVKYAVLQDKVHLDWARTCVACGYEIELMPRAASRTNSYITNSADDGDEFEVMRAGLTMAGSLETLFEGLSEVV